MVLSVLDHKQGFNEAFCLFKTMKFPGLKYFNAQEAKAARLLYLCL